ncbi:alpha/beta fold hydrolase [Spirillospora sp. NPDC048911]|uniref:alpha/beta fold hydrolase n=1 Tax=Spirillospora sp. NPDC048911 TaxID=3364527 RepID=UPI0037173755
MPIAELGDVRLFYTDDAPSAAAGSATAARPPLLLVHGYAADSQDWAWHIAGLTAAGHRVIAPDLRGHGHSSAPATGYSPEDLAADLAALLDHLGLDQVIAVGHSMGGMVASALAVERPGRVRALVCVDPAYGLPDEIARFMPAMAEGLLKDPVGAVLAMEPVLYTAATPGHVRTAHARKIQATPEHVLAQAFPAMFTDDGHWGTRPASEAHLARRACPVLTCWADPGRAAWETEQFKHPASRAIAWPGAGHRLHEERPAEFLLVVTTWLDRLAELDKETSA